MIELIEIARYRDGGTIEYVSVADKANIKTMEDAQNCQKYCIDNRIHSTTKGELYDRYPSKEGAKILNKEDFKIL